MDVATILAIYETARPVLAAARDFFLTYQAGMKSVKDTIEVADRLKGWFSGASLGAEANARLAATPCKTGSELIRLSDRVVIDNSLREAINRDPDSRALADPRILRELLDPVATALQTSMFSSQVSSTPRKLQQIFAADPESVLLNVTRANEAVRPNGTNYVPIMFMDSSRPYIGWQLHGALRGMLNCDFIPGIHPVAGQVRFPSLAFDRVRHRCEEGGLAGVCFDRQEIEKMKTAWLWRDVNIRKENILAIMSISSLDKRPYTGIRAPVKFIAVLPDSLIIRRPEPQPQEVSVKTIERKVPFGLLARCSIQKVKGRFFDPEHVLVTLGSGEVLRFDNVLRDQVAQFIGVVRDEIVRELNRLGR